MAGTLPAGPPPGPSGSNVTNLASNRGLTREKQSLQVDAPAMLCRRDYLMVSAIVLSTPATTAGALPAGPLPAHEKTQQKLHESSNLPRHLTNQLVSKLVQPTAYGREAHTSHDYTTDSAGYHDSVTTLDSQHDDSADKSRLSDYQLIPQQIPREHNTNSSRMPTAFLAHDETQQKLPESSNLPRNLTNQLVSKLVQPTSYGREAHTSHEYTMYDQPVLKYKLRIRANTRRTRDNRLPKSSSGTGDTISRKSQITACYHHVAPLRPIDQASKNGTNRKALEIRTQRHQP
ncbi:calcium lipid binding protein [Dorcoceras hygrometricum]|uniref:Calcium lipid binding protein n=1 Tax=Dorcoceras hygrometricum TaxID=472368 RepID=A0A2Z7BGR1_9LAMI|nr:calcium lipid binding protein [Dorcoceras hygrometricum]